MEDLKKYTPTELLKMVNDTKLKHDNVKQTIIDYTIEVDNLEIKINEQIAVLTELEKNYVALIEELNNR